MTAALLPRRESREWLRHRPPAPDREALREAQLIIEDVRSRGMSALCEYGKRLGDLEEGSTLIYGPDAMARALESLSRPTVALLSRTAARIRSFARQQRRCLIDLDTRLPGGRAGHTMRPVERAGCYAPGGRYPLPSTILMTAVTAATAGVAEIWVATPRPGPLALAAAALAGVDGLLAVGGAQALAALAYGAGEVPSCPVVVGPGNRWVMAAKEILAGRTRIDLLGGPSELVILADGAADAGLVAADLLAQAEHDPESLVSLVSISRPLLDAVDRELLGQSRDLPTSSTARLALARGAGILVDSLASGLEMVNRLAPEHLQIMTHQPARVAADCHHYGALFIGSASAAVLGDYGAGPNHVLPTSGTARATGGLSVLSFMCVRTWLHLEVVDPELAADAAALARLEGLEAHARAVERRVDGEAALSYPPPGS